MSDSRSDLRVSPRKIVHGHAEIASTLSLKRRPRYAETCGLEHARAWRRPRPCRLPEVRLHGNRLQASTACVVPIRVPIWQPGMRQLTSSSPPTSWRLCAPRSTLRPAVPLSRCPAVPLSRCPEIPPRSDRRRFEQRQRSHGPLHNPVDARTAAPAIASATVCSTQGTS